MRKFIVTFMASLLSCSAVFAFWPEATDSTLEIGVGYRQDSLKWKTRNNCGCSCTCDEESPVFAADFPLRSSSELEWKNLNIWLIEARGHYVTCDNVYLRANGDYGWITSGHNHDRDFRGFENDDYDYEFSHSRSHTKGHVYDAKIAVGYQFKLCDDSFSISPLIGYSWHGQHLKDDRLSFSSYDTCGCDDTVVYTDYFETYGSCCYDYYSCGGTNARYNTRWNGPFLGFDFDYRFWCDWELFGTYEFHWARYHAKAHWNFRSDLFDGFRQHAKNAYGHVFDIGFRWDFCDCWTASVKGEFQWWWADHGRDTALFAENEFCEIKTKCYLSLPIRDIKWCSAGVTIDLGMVF